MWLFDQFRGALFETVKDGIEQEARRQVLMASQKGIRRVLKPTSGEYLLMRSRGHKSQDSVQDAQEKEKNRSVILLVSPRVNTKRATKNNGHYVYHDRNPEKDVRPRSFAYRKCVRHKKPRFKHSAVSVLFLLLCKLSLWLAVLAARLDQGSVSAPQICRPLCPGAPAPAAAL